MQREADGVQRVAGREAVPVERSRAQADAGVRDEGSFPHQAVLELPVEGGADDPGQRHLCGHAGALRAAERKGQQQQVPEDAVAEPADDGEEAPDRRMPGTAIDAQAQRVLGVVEAVPQNRSRQALPSDTSWPGTARAPAYCAQSGARMRRGDCTRVNSMSSGRHETVIVAAETSRF